MMMMIQQRLLIIVLPLSSICKIEVTFISAALRPQLNFRRRRLECNDIVFPICRGRRKKKSLIKSFFFFLLLLLFFLSWAWHGIQLQAKKQ